MKGEYDLELRYSEAIRNMLNNETTLVSNRMNWMLLLQGILFSAAVEVRSSALLIGMFGVLGICISGTMYREFIAAEKAIREILRRWDMFKATRTKDQLDATPPAFAGGNIEHCFLYQMLSARRILPILFILCWFVFALDSIIFR